jgi:hypothetical protein
LCRAVICSGRRDPAVSHQEDTVPILAELVDGVIGVDTHRDTLASRPSSCLRSASGVTTRHDGCC